MLHACAPTRPLAPTLPPSVEVEGDWDDVHAVVAGVLPRVLLVQDPPAVDSPDAYECAIFSFRYGPGWLKIERLDEHIIRIDARIGRFGEPEEEHWVERALAARFTQIKGDRVAPIRIPPRHPVRVHAAP
ncbi:MAG: hypothetical protein Kow0022_03070 [Phycisphaerales bacterium]